eukprot:TRINITY_DN2335_c0_g3_i2.p1 TRINITY_DN2335_c0_g3~~TRINITY_DN2335_c0_g3_i2.p1  ORF type:complete len:655 (+),score=287.43 TRINITY_DN2335_c0_g3_i2:171-2135(+)
MGAPPPSQGSQGQPVPGRGPPPGAFKMTAPGQLPPKSSPAPPLPNKTGSGPAPVKKDEPPPAKASLVASAPAKDNSREDFKKQLGSFIGGGPRPGPKAADASEPESLSSSGPPATSAPAAPAVPKPAPKPKLKQCKATYDYEATAEGELTFQEDEIMTVKIQDDSGWWQGEKSDGTVGWFPANHVELIEEEEAPAPAAPAASEPEISSKSLGDSTGISEEEENDDDEEVGQKLDFATKRANRLSRDNLVVRPGGQKGKRAPTRRKSSAPPPVDDFSGDTPAATPAPAATPTPTPAPTPAPAAKPAATPPPLAPKPGSQIPAKTPISPPNVKKTTPAPVPAPAATPTPSAKPAGTPAPAVKSPAKWPTNLPSWEDFNNQLVSIFEDLKQNKAGSLSTNFPILGIQDENEFSFSFTSVDGVTVSHGDGIPSSMQGAALPFILAYAYEHVTHDKIQSAMEGNKSPMSPPAGFILSSLLVAKNPDPATRIKDLLAALSSAAGKQVGCSMATYLSMTTGADKDTALVYDMRARGVLKKEIDVEQVRSVYNQIHSLEIDTAGASRIAACIANGGVSADHIEVFEGAKNVKATVASMMNDEMSNSLGFPGKIGVSGVSIAIFPRIGGLAVYSPKVDKGVSVRGDQFLKQISQKFPGLRGKN